MEPVQTTDATQDSSTETTDVIEESSTSTDSNQESSPEQTPFHEHPRWKEVMAKNNSLEEQVEELKSLVTPKEEVKTEEVDYLDLLDDPKKFAEYIKNQTISEINESKQSRKNQEVEANRVINEQFKTITDKHGEVDEEAIGEFAIDNSIMNKDGSYNLVKAHKLMAMIGKAKESGAEEIKQNNQRASLVSGGGDTSATESIANISHSQLRGMSLDNLIDFLQK